jgi:hypothetical protein
MQIRFHDWLIDQGVGLETALPSHYTLSTDWRAFLKMKEHEEEKKNLFFSRYKSTLGNLAVHPQSDPFLKILESSILYLSTKIDAIKNIDFQQLESISPTHSLFLSLPDFLS